MLSMYCKRHGQTVHAISEAIRKGALGNRPIYTDAETEARTMHLRPTWLLGHGQSKPDVLVLAIDGANDHTLSTRPTETGLPLAPTQLAAIQRVAHFVEVGYGSDYKIGETHDAKTQQHQQYAALLRARGWVVHIHPIVISYSGCTTTTLRESLMTLGVTHAAAAKTLTRVAKIALDYNSKIMITRKKIRTTMATGVG